MFGYELRSAKKKLTTHIIQKAFTGLISSANAL